MLFVQNSRINPLSLHYKLHRSLTSMTKFILVFGLIYVLYRVSIRKTDSPKRNIDYVDYEEIDD